jgi:uncharacterized membrane protein YoaK (UPF0700 family)
MEAQQAVKFAHLSSTAFLMAAIAGFIDVVGFVGVDKLFTSHITGNIVVAIAEIIHHGPGVASKIIALPMFILIAIIVTGCIEVCGQSRKLLALCFVIEALFLVGFMFTGMLILPHVAENSFPYIAIAMLAVCAMSIHNTLLRTFMIHFPPCTVMTGNLTQLIIDIVSFSWGWRQPHTIETRNKSHTNIKRYGNVFIGFLVGGGCAAIGYSLISFWIVALTIILLFFMAIKSLTQ